MNAYRGARVCRRIASVLLPVEDVVVQVAAHLSDRELARVCAEGGARAGTLCCGGAIPEREPALRPDSPWRPWLELSLSAQELLCRVSGEPYGPLC